MKGLECVLVWKDECKSKPIPLGGNPIIDSRKDLGEYCYTLKRKAIDRVFDRTAPNGDVHTRTTFLRNIKKVAGLPDNIDHGDPFIGAYPHLKADLRGMLFEELDRDELIKLVKKREHYNGGDQNPYIATLSSFAGRHGIDRVGFLMQAFRMDRRTYKSKGLTASFAILLMKELNIFFSILIDA